MTTKRVLLVVALIGVLVFGWLGVVAGPGLKKKHFGEHVVYNELRGKTEAQIARSYGAPVQDWPGHETLGNPGVWPGDGATEKVNPSPPPMRTVIYHPRGLSHLEGGTLWVWYYLRGEEWVCSSSCWFADGVQF